MKLGQSDLDNVEYVESLLDHIARNSDEDIYTNHEVGIMLGVLIVKLNTDLNSQADNLMENIKCLLDSFPLPFGIPA